MRYVLFCLLILSCKSGPSEQTANQNEPQPDVHVSPPPVEPTLDDKVTGHALADKSVTIERCKKTLWSFRGCEIVYPVQGRQWVAYECATEPDPAIKSIVCTRDAEYRMRGIGGPIEREAGLATLTKLCGSHNHLECAIVVAEVMWRDRDRARGLLGMACDDDPRNSPVGLCEDIHRVMSDRYRAYKVSVTETSGVPAVSAGATCELGIVAEPPTCFARVWCGDRAVYADGSFPCQEEGRGLRGGETMTSAADLDPAISVNLGAGTLEVKDDPSGTGPALVLRGTLAKATGSNP